MTSSPPCLFLDNVNLPYLLISFCLSISPPSFCLVVPLCFFPFPFLSVYLFICPSSCTSFHLFLILTFSLPPRLYMCLSVYFLFTPSPHYNRILCNFFNVDLIENSLCRQIFRTLIKTAEDRQKVNIHREALVIINRMSTSYTCWGKNIPVFFCDIMVIVIEYCSHNNLDHTAYT